MVRKLVPENGAIYGAGFWRVCHGYYNR